MELVQRFRDAPYLLSVAASMANLAQNLALQGSHS